MSVVSRRRAIVNLLWSDLYEVVDVVGDGVRYISPLGWEVRFGFLPRDPSVTIFKPWSGEQYFRWEETPVVSEFERVLP